jgi:hypothetical protein
MKKMKKKRLNNMKGISQKNTVMKKKEKKK